MGNLAAEYGTSTAPCTTCYVSVDQLGSTRVLTDVQGNVKERHDYAPFGDELLAGIGGRTTAQGYVNPDTQPGVNVLFTGQYRDWELGSSGMASGLDYFRARHHAPALGRFMQPDPLSIGAVAPYPQTWHAYNYVANNPLVNTDPFGLFCPASGCVAPPPVPSPPTIIVIDPCSWYPRLCPAPPRGEQGEVTPPPLPPPSQPVRVPANNVRTITAAPPKPLGTKARKGTAGCISARLIHNFIGDDDTTAVTLTVNIAAGLALRKIGTKAAASLLPGPGWLYVGAAILYDVGMIGEAYFHCTNGAPEGGGNPEAQDD